MPHCRTPQVRPPSGRHWCFTINNPIPDDYLAPEDVTYAVVGNETGEGGTPHIQGYVVFPKQLRLSAVKKLLPRAHLEIARGTPQEASDYCKKEGDFAEIGTFPVTQADVQRQKWASLLEQAKKGLFEEMDPGSLICHYHALKRIRQDNPDTPTDLPKPCGVWYVGPTGVGKSHLARINYPDFYDKPLNKWWDGYQGQDAILLDDVSIEHGTWLGHLLKRWSDKYCFPAEVKGTTICIRPKKIVVTSQSTIEEVFSQDPLLIDALQRRFRTQIIKPHTL